MITRMPRSFASSINQWRMSEASNSRNLQPVYEFRVFDGTALEGLPTYLVTIHFTQAARQLMAKSGRDLVLEARKIAKSLFLSLDEPIQGRMEMRDTFADVEMLGPPSDYPDNSGTQAWVSHGMNAIPGSSQSAGTSMLPK